MIYGWVSDYFKFFNSLQTVFNRSFQATPCAVILLHVRFLIFDELKTKYEHLDNLPAQRNG